MEGRNRLSRGSSEVHTAQWQPMVGTPTLVPEPRTVIFAEDSTSGFLRRRFGGLFRNLDKAEPQFREGIFQQALLFHGQIALGFVEQNAHQIDGVARQRQFRLGLFIFAEGHHSKLHFALRAQRQHEESERRRRQRRQIFVSSPFAGCWFRGYGFWGYGFW